MGAQYICSPPIIISCAVKLLADQSGLFLWGSVLAEIVGTKVYAGCFLQRACGIKLETRKKGVVCLSVVEGGVRANLYFLDDLMFGVLVGSPDSKGWNYQTPGRCALVG